MAAGTALTLINARQNARAEIASAEKLALYLFDTPVLHFQNITATDLNNQFLHLAKLNHMRHIRIELLDQAGKIIDSNKTGDSKLFQEAPPWFETMLDGVTPKWQPTVREIRIGDSFVGKLVITPDPTYEYAEVWKQIIDSLTLALIFFVSVNFMI